MKAPTIRPCPCPNTSQEVLIERGITFRTSTFDGLKNYMREHERRTGVKLTNAAAVDLAVRSFLALPVHPDQSRPPSPRPMIGVTMPHAPRAFAQTQIQGDTQQPGAA